ncbi:hypothetical protein NPM_6360 [Nostoc sp. 'Peltigera membranacea cyanobiont' N6]|nr:hypothetical protein NPM_6360 [Nostoc sp. 'Peltigera membranacea cyanobiont' N6]
MPFTKFYYGIDSETTKLTLLKGLPNKKISQIFLWDGQDAHPTRWIIYFLESPKKVSS